MQYVWLHKGSGRRFLLPEEAEIYEGEFTIIREDQRFAMFVETKSVY